MLPVRLMEQINTVKAELICVPKQFIKMEVLYIRPGSPTRPSDCLLVPWMVALLDLDFANS
jgi:hypothetical protein